MGWGLRTHSAQPCIRAIRDIRILYRYMGPLRVGPQRHEYGTQRTRVRGLEFRVRGLGCTSAFSVIHIMISDLSPSKGRLFRVPVGPAEGAHTVCSVEGLKAQRSRDFTPKQRIKTSKKALIIRYPKKNENLENTKINSGVGRRSLGFCPITGSSPQREEHQELHREVHFSLQVD